MKLVVVDDSPALQRSLGKLLRSVAGVELVGFAEDLAGARCLIDAAQPDIVVLDVELGHGDKGLDVLRYALRTRPGTKVVALSNSTAQPVRDAFLAAGASAYFDKSMEFREARDWVAALAGPASGAPAG